MEANKLTCGQANQIDLVDFLNSLGHQPTLTRNNDYWYLSPLRREKHASFKVNRKLNVWYDHGWGNGGTLVDFATQYFNCGVSEALNKISFFHQQKSLQNIIERPPFHSHENSFNPGVERETAIKIIAAKQPIQDLVLCSYLNRRRIEKVLPTSTAMRLHLLTPVKKNYTPPLGLKITPADMNKAKVS